MDKSHLIALLVAAAPWLLSALFALLYWLAPKGEKAVAAAIRKAADGLTPAQHDIVEQAIAWVDKQCADLTGPEKLAAAVAWAQKKGAPINAAYVQAVYSVLTASGKKG